ncbi:sensor histidine kinase [Roseomonas sp. CCTCC AB2023176]|uniref:sensor histidine kinase n=1 Tax=Roseomonas sp. CCTCC AB2023176 TaxID=3342640 RepID=UPI0035DCB6F0
MPFSHAPFSPAPLSKDDPLLAAEPAWALERLAFALDVADVVGCWDWDVARDRVVADARFCRLFGVSEEEGAHGVPIAAFLAAMHPDDRSPVQATIEEALREDRLYRAEYRVVQPDGSVRWVLARGRALRDTARNSIRFPGVAVDITDRKQAEAALIESESRFRTIADAMPQIVWSTRADGHHDYYNRRWYEVTGTKPGETDGAGWAGIFHPDDQPEAWRRWNHSLSTGEPYEVEYRLRLADGRWRWFLGRAVPVRDEAGAITRWFGTCTDIHDMRRAAEERELLSHELSHRIKNIFSVTASLVSLAARRHPEALAFAADLRRRIEALGHAHEFARPHSKDSRPGLGRGTLFAFLRELLAPYAGGVEGRLRLDGEDQIFDDGAATPLALLFHELATNAAKYGAFSDPVGHVAIDVRPDGDELLLTWREGGGPRVGGPPARDGFGTQIATLSVQGQLSGRVERRWLPDGLEVEVRVPAGALRRRRAVLGRAGQDP